KGRPVAGPRQGAERKGGRPAKRRPQEVARTFGFASFARARRLGGGADGTVSAAIRLRLPTLLAHSFRVPASAGVGLQTPRSLRIAGCGFGFARDFGLLRSIAPQPGSKDPLEKKNHPDDVGGEEPKHKHASYQVA